MRRITLLAAAMTAATLIMAGAAFGLTNNALWKMEDPTVLYDESANDNDGTTSDITSVEGTDGKGYHFNGSTSIATVPDDDSLDPNDAGFAITANVKFDDPPSKTVGDYDIIRKGLSSTKGGDYKIEILRSGKRGNKAQAFCYFKDANRTVGKISAGPNLADGEWHEVICTKSDRKVRLRVDGEMYTNYIELDSISNDAPVIIGAKVKGSDSYDGDMDEVAINTF